MCIYCCCYETVHIELKFFTVCIMEKKPMFPPMAAYFPRDKEKSAQMLKFPDTSYVISDGWH